ncbi:hypothetical protein B0H12DRAFT_779588 [Mycena haematopus]|nr:hypothetical protein B0H12DRAFT_779588 [Mycena haematopus]
MYLSTVQFNGCHDYSDSDSFVKLNYIPLSIQSYIYPACQTRTQTPIQLIPIPIPTTCRIRVPRTISVPTPTPTHAGTRTSPSPPHTQQCGSDNVAGKQPTCLSGRENSCAALPQGRATNRKKVRVRDSRIVVTHIPHVRPRLALLFFWYS